MKRIREIALELREGTSDKVYEVDLCEVGPDRFVVNFRFGRRGTRLQEGSKTPLAVARAEADRVFDKLVAEKTDKGYRERTAAPAAAPPPPVPEAPAALPGGDDPRARALVAILAATSGSSDSVVQARKGGWTADPDRLIFRAGELRITEAAAWIARFASRDCGDRRAWNIARALLRCGDPETLPTAAAIAQDPNRPGWVRTLARHAVAALSGGAAAEVTDLEVAAAAGDSAAWLAELSARPERLDDWYLAAADSPNFRAVLGSIPLVGPTFGGVRRVYKAAEAKGDGPVWGLLARRIEQEKCGSGPPASGAGRFAMRFVRARPTGGTRTYLRRRSWRALRRLGEAGLANEYCRMAAGLALAYVDPPPDAEGEAPRRRRRSRASGPWHTSQWALSQVLFSGGPRWSADRKRLRGHRGPALPWAREERFPELWDQCPEILAELLDQSRLAEAHQFAARALKANPAAWPSLPVARLVGWFGAPYPETLALATEVALTRYDPAAPDLELVGALLGCAHAHARTTAEGWIRSNPAPYLASTSFVIGLLLSPRVEARRFALEWLGGATLRPDHARAVVDAVLARVRVVAIDDGVLRDAAAVLVAGFARELSDVPLDTVAELLRHPSAGVAELGAKILLGHRAPATELPDDLLAAAMTSPHVAVRGIGIRRYGELPDSVLAERFRVLVHLVVNPNADVRYAVAPIVVRLAGGTGGSSGFARVLLAALVPLLVIEGSDGMHRDVVRLLRTELRSVLPLVEPALVFRLLRASETVVQELGGDLLRSNVEPGSLTPFQLAVLASSDVLGVRDTAFALLGHRVDAVRAQPESILPLLDARWAEARERAIAFVEGQIGADAIPADVALAVCDSVRPEVQALGRRLVTARFEGADGLRYLMRLAQHPAPEMAAYAASWLEQYAEADPERIERLLPFFVTVLTRPNRGRVAKLRVLQFVERQLVHEPCARVLLPMLGELVLTTATSHRERYVEMLATVGRHHPHLPNPLVRIAPEVRGAV